MEIAIIYLMTFPAIWHLVIAYAKQIKLMKGKALRKHSMQLKTAALVLLNLFISDNDRYHTTDAP